MNQALVTASTVLQTVIFALLLWKLCRHRLVSKYRAFAGLIFFEIVRVTVSGQIPRNSNTYAQFYFATQPVVWFLYAFVTLEVYQSVFRTLPGISRFSRYIVAGSTTFAVAVSALSLVVQAQAEARFPKLEIYFTMERAMFLSLLTFVLVLVGFLAWYPVPVHRNAVVYSGVFFLFFAAKTGALLLRTLLGPDYALIASLLSIAAGVVSALLWLTLLNEAGEARRVRSRRAISEEREKQLVGQLQSFNDALLRSVPDRM